MKNYYEILGISSKATKNEVKEAYRRLAKIWHPDACKEPDAHSKFIEITEAYEILIDEVSRDNYDRLFKESQNQFNHQSTYSNHNSKYESNHHCYKQYEQDTYEARKKAETYYGMTLEEVLTNIVGVVIEVAKETVKYTVMGDQSVRLSLGERMGIGFNMTILIILGILSFTGILAPITLPLALATIRTLLHKGQYIGIGKLLSSTLLFLCVMIVAVIGIINFMNR